MTRLLTEAEARPIARTYVATEFGSTHVLWVDHIPGAPGGQAVDFGFVYIYDSLHILDQGVYHGDRRVFVDWRDRTAYPLPKDSLPKHSWEEYAEIGNIHEALIRLAGGGATQGVAIDTVIAALMEFGAGGQLRTMKATDARLYLEELIQDGMALHPDGDTTRVYYGTPAQRQRFAYGAARG